LAFNSAGVAFLTKHCIRCHGDDMPKAGLALNGFRDEASVLKARKRWDTVLEMVESGEMPPDKEPQPTADELAGFTTLVHGIFEKADNSGKVDPGQITIRRLNRNEYNNTVRDLFGVDFKAAEDFPADDVGYGFDNIGDVLTVSPVHMERYLAAAEQIASRVIIADLQPPSKRYQSARYSEPAGGEVPMQGKFRTMKADSDKHSEAGPVFTSSFKITPDDEYFLRARLFAKTEGKKPVRVALFAAGKELTSVSSDQEIDQLAGTFINNFKPLKILDTFEVKAGDEKSTRQIEVSIKNLGGVQRVGLALIKPDEGEPMPTLYIEHLMSEGPLDTRPMAQRKLLAGLESKPNKEKTRGVFEKLVPQAYRRPAEPQEVANLVKFVEQTVSSGEKWEIGMQRAIQAILCSPKFLFRVELDNRPESSDAHAINEFQLASRLSYFIWSSMPDDELLALAGKGQLSRELQPQVRRMLKDPKAAALVDNFAMQWLQLGKLQTLAPDAKLFPNFNDRLRMAMIGETNLFLQEIVREDRSVLDMIDADFTYLNEPIARLYGVADTLGNRWADKPKQKGPPFRGDVFVRVPLKGDQRGGLLTQASILTVTSNPTRTSPVKRGRWVLEQILGTPPPPPPPNVPELDAEKQQAAGTLRERMELHRKNPACANCHARMDPIGFAFENYNAIGAFRDKDDERPIDPSGVLPDGKSFQGAGDLKKILLEKKELFLGSLAEKMLTYALGRGLEYYDKRAVDKIVATAAREDYKFSSLVIAIAESEPCRMRRGKEQTP